MSSKAELEDVRHGAASVVEAPPITRPSDHRAGHRLDLLDWLDKGRG